MFTVGFEVENFIWDDFSDERFEEYKRILRRYGFDNFHWDYSGPYEFNSPPYPAFSRIPNPYAIIVGLLFEFDGYEMRVYDDGDDRIRTAGNHCHIAFEDYKMRTEGNYEKLYKYLVKYLPLFQWLMSLTFEVDGGRVEPIWTDVEERRYWADAPPSRMPRSRGYYVITGNEEGIRKPFTLEIRICETWPLKCLVAIRYLLAGYLANVQLPHRIRYYATTIPLKPVLEYIERVEVSTPDLIPQWTRTFVRKLLEDGDVRITEDAVRRGYLPLREVIASLMEAGVVVEVEKLTPVGHRHVGRLVALVYAVTRKQTIDRRICKYANCSVLGF